MKNGKQFLTSQQKTMNISIVDNMSNDNSRKIIEKHISGIAKFISERDDGMYDALNKRLFSISKGVIFFTKF